MAELTEVILPKHSLGTGHRNIILPAGSKTIGIEVFVLQVQEVNLLARNINAHSTKPCVEFIVILEPRGQHFMVIEVLLRTNDIVVFLQEIFADAGCSCIARTVGINLNKPNLLRKTINIQRGDTKPLTFLSTNPMYTRN